MTKSERKVLKDQMGPQIWTSKDMMKAFAFGMFVSALMAFPMVVNADIVHKFKNPSFSGVGTGAHYLTIENQEFQREKAIKDALDAARRAAEREAENSTLAKFIRNLKIMKIITQQFNLKLKLVPLLQIIESLRIK